MQFFAWLEAHCFAWSDADLGAGSRIAADAGLAGSNAEYAKTAEFDAISGSQGLFEALKDRVHG